MSITPAALAALVKGDMANFVAASTPGGIEAQEAQGQRDMIEQCRVPRDFDEATGVRLAACGITLRDGADAMFFDASLPKGWSIVPSDHAMWSYIVDGAGANRFQIFYKAAFYDRSARMSVVA